ncbi:MAG: nucleoside deaminase [Gemmatimonadetes bacterium]|nr:nucleoside deaminase [Gemmatimonadota bacterium]
MARPERTPRRIEIDYPPWVESQVDWSCLYAERVERVRLVIELARENVLHETGGPFGGAVFEGGTGRLVAVGVNLVVPSRNSVLHAEILALMGAESRLGSHSLGAPGMPRHELVTSCEPCAMCLGAILWSGVTRLVAAASRDDARRLGFDEGPLFPESYRYVEERGVEIVRGVLREESVAVLRLYEERGGIIYNG